MRSLKSDWIFHSSSSNTRKRKNKKQEWRWSVEQKLEKDQDRTTPLYCVLCVCVFGAEIKLADSDSFPGPWFLGGDMNKAKLFKTGPLKRCKRAPKQVRMVFHGFVFHDSVRFARLYPQWNSHTLLTKNVGILGEEMRWRCMTCVYFLWFPDECEPPSAMLSLHIDQAAGSTLTWWFRITHCFTSIIASYSGTMWDSSKLRQHFGVVLMDWHYPKVCHTMGSWASMLSMEFPGSHYRWDRWYI